MDEKQALELMAENATAVIGVLIWTIGAIGTAFLIVAGWAAKQVLNRLTGIETELKVTNKTLSVIETDLKSDIGEVQGDLMSLDTRVSIIETKCMLRHDSPPEYCDVSVCSGAGDKVDS